MAVKEHSMKSRLWTATLATILAAGTLSIATATPARAESGKEKLYRVGTYAGAATTAYGVVKGSPGIAIAGAAGTYLAHKGWKDEVNDRHDDRWRGGRNGRNNGYGGGYGGGYGRYDDYGRGGSRYDDYGRGNSRYDVYDRNSRRDDCDDDRRGNNRRGSYGGRRR
jgi:uncharacterized membrane protein